MGLSFSSMFSLFMSPKDVRVCLVGLDAAGKSTMLHRLKFAETVTTVPTIGFTVETVEYKSLRMNVYDIGGQERLRKLWSYYYENTDAIIFAVDSSDRARFAEAAAELHRALSDDNLRNATLLIFANKQDLPTAASVGEVQSALKLNDLRGRKWFIQGCSATSGNGLYEGLDVLATNIKS